MGYCNCINVVNLCHQRVLRTCSLFRSSPFIPHKGCRPRGNKLKFLSLKFPSRCYSSHHTNNMFGLVETYNPPEWAAKLNYIPSKRVHLSMANTPIHPWNIPGVPADFSVSVKRDDLSGCALSGNKDVKAIGCEGNVLVNRVCGADIYVVPRNSPYLTHLAPRMARLAKHIQSTKGESSYLIPVGGSNKVGLFGYMNAFEELIQQGVLEHYDDMVFPCGSGGTAAGLAIANHLTGGHLRLHGITISDSAPFFYKHVEENLQALGLTHIKATDLLRIVDGYKGRGYGLSTDKELEFIHQVAVDTSMLLDPVYTGKATLGMVTEMNNCPSAFKGRQVLYLHTGGIFGLFDGRMTRALDEEEERQPRMTMWPIMDDCPL